ncbi:MAG: type II toxin-antitoxin system Phd/YefM family antitoxin [Candidatus Liptonbacteria bacterium]|nr:type II toxin-antitoxin system Phd/YefM family antitoxin [Candidatus Liptonbacteria bacterium]
MTNVVSALTARTQFGQILKRVSGKNERFVVGRRGEPQAVIMGIKEYLDCFAPAPEELRAMQATAKRTGRSKLTMREVNVIIAKARRQQEFPT